MAAEAGAEAEGGNLFARVTTADLVGCGLEPEFVGRIPVRVALARLGEPELLRVLTEAKQNVAEQMQADFASYGIALSFTPCALQEVARRAATQGTGARGLLTILEAALRPYNFELPSTAVRSLEVRAPHAHRICTASEPHLRRICTASAPHLHRICTASALQVDAEMIREPQLQLEKLLERLELEPVASPAPS